MNNTKYPTSNYKEIRLALKLEMKLLTETHTALKRERKDTWSSYRDVRTKHIAYSMFKGSSFEQVESKWKEPLNSNNHYIKSAATKLYESYLKRIIVAEDANEIMP